MLKIRLYKDNEEVGTFRIDKSLVQIGRAEGCDIRLQDPSLSREHCLLRKRDNRWMLEDSSLNGIHIEGQPCPSPTVLDPKIRYQFGRRFSFEVATNKPEKIERTLLLGKRSTQILSGSSEHFVCGDARLTCREPSGELITRRIDSHGLSVGAHESNDIVLSDESVSSFHARFDFQHGEYFVTDLGSTNGSFLAGTKVLKASLKGKQSLRFGSVDVEFNLNEVEHRVTARKENHFFGMQSQNSTMKKVFAMTEAVAETDAAVFLHGETGTGKEMLAKAVHQLSHRSKAAFIAINCAALPKEIMESELFGHEKGAFTGALQQRKGAFEAASGGSIFLDEIAELDPALQAKLLRVLESGEVKRVGSNTPNFIDLRVISATHKDLAQLVKEGRFREDLFYRLHVIPLELLPLRKRPEDLELLIPSLLDKLDPEAELDPKALESLKRYSFPGNIRELKNILQRALVECELKGDCKKIGIEHFRFIKELEKLQLDESPEDRAERQRLLECLERNAYNQSQSSRELGIPVSTLHDRIRRLGIEIPKKPTRRVDKAI